MSLAALVAVRPACRPRLIYREHADHRRRKDRRKGFTETDAIGSTERPVPEPTSHDHDQLTRTCVILNGHIWSLTWADVDTAHLMFWRHGAVRRGGDAARDAQTDITLPTSLGLSGYIFSAPYGVSAGHESFLGDTPT
jgi:hypothetical protein